MNNVTRNSRLFAVVALLAVLLRGGQLASAQAPNCAAEVPQWVKDRQEYEPSYVYVPPVINMELAPPVEAIPQWVRDRQQYETSYVYVPPVHEAPITVSANAVPQWVLDRQQYETSYVYTPPMNVLVLEGAHC